MDRKTLIAQINTKKSFLCVGLDVDLAKMPRHFLDFEDPVFEFNKCVIDATKDICVAYKPNIAFYEALGVKGWESLAKTLAYIPDDIFTIADAKRGDIGNTSRLYAKTFFETFDFDAVTIAPYMGEDSVVPFLEFEGKWVILLGLTSNKGSRDFQHIISSDGMPLYESVITKAQSWGTKDQLMFVVGATNPNHFAHIREIAPESFLLVPGIGAQGGDLESVIVHGAISDEGGLLINSSRGIIYAGEGDSCQKGIRDSAMKLRSQMQFFFEKTI